MINNLINLANKLDQIGFYKEVDILDSIIVKANDLISKDLDEWKNLAHLTPKQRAVKLKLIRNGLSLSVLPNNHARWPQDISNWQGFVALKSLKEKEYVEPIVKDVVSEVNREYNMNLSYTFIKWGGSTPDGIPTPQTHYEYIIHDIGS